ncbi:MAG: lytic transglycosylase domain-containing protein [Bacteroidales bacterium]|nr:lytic transglycosylase domain-containing protein [Bacteroidales bacterium]
MKKQSTISIIILLSIIVVAQVFIFATRSDSATAALVQADNIKKQQTLHVYSPALPDSMSFAGEPVPLDIYYVREGLDREMIVNTFGHTNTLLYFKRAHRYFPIIEPILKKNGIPSDFKYLCVIESGLTNATSPAKAQGFWQFIKTTGQKYGLEVNDEIDMRNNLEASTEAACKYLKSLHTRFGSWTAAAAAYNCGENGLQKNMERQSIDSYYNTRLNNETTRYVYRILAVKQIMQHPQDYGFYLRPIDLYPSLQAKTAILSGQNVDLYNFAKENGVTYKVLREFNPWITTDKLTNKANKSYTVKLPVKNGTSLSHIRTERDKGTEFITKM